MDVERDPYAPTPPPGQHELPFEDGVPMESNRHRVQMNLLIDTLASHWEERSDIFVGGNMFVYFSEAQTRKNDFRGPDVFVVLDTERKKERLSWVVWEEGGLLPSVVIELLSDSTRKVDRGEKMQIYERIWKVGTYVLYDPWSLELEAYALGPQGRFVRVEPDVRGDLPVAPLGLSLGIRPTPTHEDDGPFLRWIDRGEIVRNGNERADTERERADTERERADTERERADTERERAERAERRIAELEAALRRT